MSMMKAAIFEEFGEPAKVLSMQEAPIPSPKAGEVLIKMKRSPAHNHDILTVRGEYGDLPELPAIGGTEAMGVIAETGSDVTDLTKGMRVTVAGIHKTWAEYFVAPAAAVVPVPDDVSDEAAAQLIAMPSSSMMALNKIPAKSGEWIAINAANGAVGKSIIQMSAARGLKTIAIVGRASAKEELEKLGATLVFVSSRDGWVEDAKREIDGHVAGGIEMIGGKAAREMISLLGQGATILTFGAMSNEPMLVDSSEMIFKEITMKGFWGLMESNRTTPEEMSEIISELIKMLQKGQLQLPVHQTYGLDQIAQAGEDYYKRRDGKLMVAA